MHILGHKPGATDTLNHAIRALGLHVRVVQAGGEPLGPTLEHARHEAIRADLGFMVLLLVGPQPFDHALPATLHRPHHASCHVVLELMPH